MAATTQVQILARTRRESTPSLSCALTVMTPLPPRQCDRVAKVMDSKSIGLCPQGFKSPRCRIAIATISRAATPICANAMSAPLAQWLERWSYEP